MRTASPDDEEDDDSLYAHQDDTDSGSGYAGYCDCSCRFHRRLFLSIYSVEGKRKQTRSGVVDAKDLVAQETPRCWEFPLRA